MECPRCKSQLSYETIKDLKITFEVDVCHNCGGMWFDQGELARIDKIIQPTLVEIRKIPRESVQLKALYCPSCNDHPLMEKAEHPRDSKVIFDFCPECKGVWLDKGELEAIQKESWLITMGKIFKWLMGKD